MAWSKSVFSSSSAVLAMCACLCSANTSAAAEPDRLLPLEVVINAYKSGTWLLLEHDGKLYAPHDAFEDWRVRLDAEAQSIAYKGQNYWPLYVVPGYQSKLNTAEQSLELLFSPSVFSSTRLTQEGYKKPILSPVLPSAFFNYDLNYTRSELRGAPATEDLGLLGELGFSYYPPWTGP